MVVCNKRQKVIKRSKNLIRYRCMNKRSGMHGQEVDEAICSRCPSPSVKHARLCRKKVKPRPAPDAKEFDKEEMRELLSNAGMCNEDIEKVQNIQDLPSMPAQLWTYAEALLKWIKAGRPTRDQEEVNYLLNTYCNPATPCDWYDKDSQRCRGCGCKVTTSSFAVANKLKMKTERCPQGKF